MTITLTYREQVAVLTLTRPQVHNVIDLETMAGWEQCLKEIERENPLAVILTGEGEQSFCAGGDLNYFTQLRDQMAVDQMSRRMQALLNKMYEGPRPVIAAVNGNAYGGGCEILTACHLRIASAQARFQFRQSAMGVVTGWGGGTRLLRELGRGSALSLLLTGASVDAVRAREIGFIQSVVAPNHLMEEAHNWAAMIASRAPEAVRAFLELARINDTKPMSDTRKKETDLFVALWQRPWFQRAMDDFVEKKPAAPTDQPALEPGVAEDPDT